ncbi:MAG TPA: hypothetical protein VE175_09630 [Woeseiaceae bacterium]|jgi:hypothetical protein|nr:hypothetical protein [Woeseiaceae bacterium]
MTYRSVIAIALLTPVSTTTAQERIVEHVNSLRTEYQYVHTDTLDTTIGPLEIGETDAHVLLLSGTFWLNDRWQVFGTVPYVRKRHHGAEAHDPVRDFDQYMAPDLRVIDDGRYHGGLQDFHGGVQYLAIDGAFSLSPFVSFGIPLSDYPTYGSAAIGKQLRELPVGVSMEFSPYFSDWLFQADLAYVLSEKKVGVNLNYWLAYASASYYLSPRFAPRVFVAARQAPNGLKYPDDFPDYDNANGYYHDVTLKHSYVNAGVGLDYVVNDRYEIAATYFRTVDPDNVAETDYAFTVALTRLF